MNRRPVAILGSTGSIGTQTLDVIRRHRERFAVCGLAAGRNARLLAAQIREFQPERAYLADAAAAAGLAAEGLPVTSDAAVLEEMCASAGVVVNGLPRAHGLSASLATVRAGRRLALANKESLVLAGALLRAEAARTGAEIVPVDSEHSAIFQAARAGQAQEIRRIVLTASGGPFRGATYEEMRAATPERALRHPTWEMGSRITVDSATLMNKAFEIIEARWLFDVPPERIEVLVHPQSIVHSLVEFVDGSVIAQMGVPDMRVPIQYALSHPERWDGVPGRLDLARVGRLEFEPTDRSRFPSLEFGYRAAREGGVLGAVLHGANDAAVEAFLAGRIPLTAIFDIVGEVLAEAQGGGSPDERAILEADEWARARARAKGAR
jgi:1-deoxy-D-xylulose-5-phosphate reductoisomerase